LEQSIITLYLGASDKDAIQSCRNHA